MHNKSVYSHRAHTKPGQNKRSTKSHGYFAAIELYEQMSLCQETLEAGKLRKL